MKNKRLLQLFHFLEEDPNDPFTIYAIATEYKQIDSLKALEYYEKLLNDHKNYVGTYYHAAALYGDLGMDKKARETYEKGMEVAKEQNDQHAFRELKSAYDEFMMDY